MMRAAVLTGNNGIDVVDCQEVLPGAGQVRVRLEGTGVCASNLPVWEGRPWFHYPMAPGAPGHEGWGVIDAIGDGVSRSLTGRRVTFLSNRAYAQWDVAAADSVVPIPEQLGDSPCPGEPLACAVNVMHRAAVQPDETVVVVGVGFLGALLVRLAAHGGAHVIALSRRPFACELALALGASKAIPLADRAAAADAVSQDTDGQMAHCVIEAAGTQEALDVASDLTRIRGRLVIAGYHQDGLRHVNLQSWNWRGLDVINAHERDERIYVRGMTTAIALLRTGVLDLAPLLTHAVTLDQLGDSFRLMQERPDGFLKAFVRFEEAS